MIKVARDERNIDVAAFTNWFAVVDRFQNGEPSRMFLNLARECVQIFGALVGRVSLPDGSGAACGLYGCVDIRCASLRDVGDFFASSRIGRFKIFSFGWRLPFATDEVAKAALVRVEPD